MRTYSLVFSCAFLLFVSAGCAGEDGAASAATASGRGGGAGGPAVPVAVGTVVQKAMPIEISVIGAAEAFSSVAIRAQTTGQLTSVNFTEGSVVRKGDLLRIREVIESAFADFYERQLGSRPRQVFGGAQYVHHRWLMEPWGCFVAEENESKIVGASIAVCWGSVGLIGPLAVLTTYQNQKIAQGLIELKQVQTFGPIYIRRQPASQPAAHSEEQ